MYISKVALSPTPQARAELVQLARNGAYAAHQLLWRLFTSDDQRSFLFREEQGAGGLPVFYVLSASRPERNSPVLSVAVKDFNPQLQKGDRLAYRIRVNPTISISTGEGKSKRHDVLMHAKRQAKQRGISDAVQLQALMFEAAQQWFVDDARLARWGFSVDALPDIDSYTQHKVVGKSGRPVQFSSADLQGTLTVQDPEAFSQCVFGGLGKSKAFGCGLMLLRRIA